MEAESTTGDRRAVTRYLDVGAVRLRWALHRATASVASLVVLTGRTEFIEKYDEVVRTAIDCGFDVVVFDWRGQGGSSRLLTDSHKGHVRSFDDYLEDIDKLLEAAAAEGIAKPYLMLGHSMGGHIGLRYLARSPGIFAAALFTAPMVDINIETTPRWFAQALAAAATRLGFAGRYAFGQKPFAIERQIFAGNRLTGSDERYRAFVDLLQRYPDHVLGGATYGWLNAAFASIDVVNSEEFADAVRVPVWICQSSEDRIVDNRAQTALVDRLPQARLITFEGARHEILLESEPLRQAFFEELEDFLQRMPASPPADQP